MIRYENAMGYSVKETNNYRTTYLLDTDYNVIKFVQSLHDFDNYRVDVIELGNNEREPKTITMYGDAAKEIYNSFMNRVQA